MTYKAIKLIKRPQTTITPDVFEVMEMETPTLGEGQILVRQTHMSLDPAMRGWMNEDRNSYIPPVELGDVMRSNGVGEVVESQNEKFPVGTRVAGLIGWTEYLATSGAGLNPVPPEIDPEAILAVLSLPGITAYHGLMEVARPKAGETVLVTGAAGSVGSIVGQIAKAEGLRVIGVAGSDEKCKWLTDELGFDAVINYKTADLDTALTQAAPDGIDVFFENTGGPIQHVAINHMNPHGRVAICGMIADYNRTTAMPGPSWILLLKRRLRVEGFTMPDERHRWGELSQKVGAYLMAGQIKYRTHVLEGLESAIDGINLLFSGENRGKLMVKL
ncbi:NADP-dependent oxidoreductase [Exilibacterium tricleocarpae]|uniref:NADP-dependent oxidoreductase n=1 Tax=Exilibacterium tricleocarpae TaxID=2591008 RepID=A0A545TZP5_9GAMM|nr:NADP-dependent oxidoreductase [Exilibacterium tricleocarpae]TQV82686.1 NADP-dependent oxidoreductase [Exilibacterium tricleocarpae]